MSAGALQGALPPGITARTLDARDADVLAALCATCAAFFELVADDAPAADTARHLLASRPAEVAPSRKHVIGFERGPALVAVVDLLEGYPVEADWYVGLLLVTPADRARGFGTLLWHSIEGWIRAGGGRRVRLLVQEQNEGAARFWRSVGFDAAGAVEQRLATRTNQCWSYQKELAGT